MYISYNTNKLHSGPAK